MKGNRQTEGNVRPKGIQFHPRPQTSTPPGIRKQCEGGCFWHKQLSPVGKARTSCVLHNPSSTSPPQLVEASKDSRIGHLVRAGIGLFCGGVDPSRSDLDLFVLLNQGAASAAARGAKIAATATLDAVLFSERRSVDALEDT